jgi:hypothetical protein
MTPLEPDAPAGQRERWHDRFAVREGSKTVGAGIILSVE